MMLNLHGGIILILILNEVYTSIASVTASECDSSYVEELPFLSCTFENGTCGFDLASASLPWTRDNSGIGYHDVGDHTTGKGWYATPSFGNRSYHKGSEAELITPYITEDDVCFQFWYNFATSLDVNMRLLLKYPDNNAYTSIWDKRHKNSYGWQKVSLRITNTKTYQIVFRSLLEYASSTQKIAIDDINIFKLKNYTTIKSNVSLHQSATPLPKRTTTLSNNPHTTPSTRLNGGSDLIDSVEITTYNESLNQEKLPISCTFENGSCGWHHSVDGDFPWHTSNMNTHSRNVPTHDHTNIDTASGHYLYIKGRESYNSSRKAVLESRTINTNENMLISFWYFANGVGIGTLSLRRHFINGSDDMLWSVSGRQGQHWKEAIIELTPGNYKLSIVATARLHYGSDLALDDVEFLPQIDQSTTPKVLLANTDKVLSLPITCDFGDNYCSFDVESRNKYVISWNKTSGPLDIGRYRYIAGDHTSGNGSYMSLTVNTKYAEREDTSELVSPTFSTNDSSCLMFYYVFPTSVSGTIDVYQRQLDNNLVVILNKISGSVGPSWRFFSVDVPASKKFKIVIEGSYAGEDTSVLAIDDVTVKSGKCADFPTGQTTRIATAATTVTPKPSTTVITRPITTSAQLSTLISETLTPTSEQNPSTTTISSTLKTITSPTIASITTTKSTKETTAPPELTKSTMLTSTIIKTIIPSVITSKVPFTTTVSTTALQETTTLSETYTSLALPQNQTILSPTASTRAQTTQQLATRTTPKRTKQTPSIATFSPTKDTEKKTTQSATKKPTVTKKSPTEKAPESSKQMSGETRNIIVGSSVALFCVIVLVAVILIFHFRIIKLPKTKNGKQYEENIVVMTSSATAVYKKTESSYL